MCQFLTCIATVIVALFLHRFGVIDANALWIIISLCVFKLSSMIDDIIELFSLAAQDAQDNPPNE